MKAFSVMLIPFLLISCSDNRKSASSGVDHGYEPGKHHNLEVGEYVFILKDGTSVFIDQKDENSSSVMVLHQNSSRVILKISEDSLTAAQTISIGEDHSVEIYDKDSNGIPDLLIERIDGEVERSALQRTPE